MKEEEKLSLGIKIFLIIFIIITLLEVTMLVGFFFFSDKVECNFIWCTFTKTIQSSECYVNGEMVNCSEIDSFSYIPNG